MTAHPEVGFSHPDSEAALLALAQSGDSVAFCELCQRYAARLVRQAVALCGDAALAEDLAQDVLLEAWKNLHRYRGQARLFTWLCGILINRHRNWRRRRRPVSFSTLVQSDSDVAACAIDNLIDPSATPRLSLEQAERAQRLQSCLDQLPAKQRAVVYLRFFVDDSLESIACALGCSVGTVKSRLYHGLDRLTTMPDINALRNERQSYETMP